MRPAPAQPLVIIARPRLIGVGSYFNRAVRILKECLYGYSGPRISDQWLS